MDPGIFLLYCISEMFFLLDSEGEVHEAEQKDPEHHRQVVQLMLATGLWFS